MACPHCSISIIKRSAGASAVAASAYQSRSDIFNEYRQQEERYARKRNTQDDVVHLEVMLPDNAPAAYADRAVLWNAVEEVEDQCNSQLARRVVLTLPNEVPRDNWEEMIRQYCQEQFVSKGMCADVAIHYTEPPPNPHAHILLTLRSMDENGRWLPKYKKVPCDDGMGNPVYDENGKIKLRPVNTNGWNDRGNAEIWRTAWADKQNEFLERCGSPVRVDLRSYERQGIFKIPTIHMGKDTTALVHKGGYSYLKHLNDDIKETNGFLVSLQKAVETVLNWFVGWVERRDELMDRDEIRRDPPIIADLYSWWLLRHDQRSDWSSGRAAAKCGIKDWSEVQDLIAELRDMAIYTTEDAIRELDNMETDETAIRDRLKQIDRRIKDIPAIIEAAETVQRLQPIKTKSQYGFASQKASYTNTHSAQLAEYNTAYRKLMKLSNDSHVEAGALNAELAELTRNKSYFTAQLDEMKPRLKILRRVRKCVQAVYADADREEQRYRREDAPAQDTLAEKTERRNKPDRDGWDMAV